jgi:regulator of nucleoside diphosphate kinase
MITTEDYERLEALRNSEVARLLGGFERLDELQAELNLAHVVPQDSMPADVVTMDSTVTLRDLDTDELNTYTLVYPDRADITNHKLSVLATIGTAILGCRVGDELEWRVPEGRRRLKIDQVVFPPERAEARHL